MSAREEVLGFLLERWPDGQGQELATQLGAELRVLLETELRAEHEDDLRRARSRSFNLGVRAVLRQFRQTGRIDGDEEANLVRAFEAQPEVVDRDRLRADFDGFVREMPEEWQTISDVPVPWVDSNVAPLVEDLIEIVDRYVP